MRSKNCSPATRAGTPRANSAVFWQQCPMAQVPLPRPRQFLPSFQVLLPQVPTGLIGDDSSLHLALFVSILPEKFDICKTNKILRRPANLQEH